jgi:glycosidase
MAEIISSENTAESTQPITPGNASIECESPSDRSRARGVTRRTVLLCLGLALAGALFSQFPGTTTSALAQGATQSADNYVKPTGTPVSHTFVYRANKKLKSASVVGIFNNWNKTANPMTVDADGLTWRATVPLEIGRSVYKFVLFSLNGQENWMVDPNAPLDETDKVNDNSVLLVTPADYKIPASPIDGITAASALVSLSGLHDVGYDEGNIILSFRARPNDLSQIYLRSLDQSFPMKLVRTDDLYAYYKAVLPWDRRQDLTYTFELVDGKIVQEYDADGLNPQPRPFKILAEKFQPYLLTDAPEPLKMDGPLTTQAVAGPSWAKNQPIYEINLDVYGFPRGTALREFEKHLPVLKEMGVGLLWFMPLHPRAKVKSFGSPYAVQNYTEINPDLGTKAEFRHLVESAHALGLRVLMDWVPNHTSWDNPMIEAHPEFYVKNERGGIAQAYDWFDTAQLDYGQPAQWNQLLWNQMRDNMAFWVRDFDIDGFRADVAGSNGKVPAQFWSWLRPQLDAIKPVFMLAEADNPEVHPAFDMTYSWNLPPVLWDICAGRKPASAIDDELRKEARTYPDGSIRMRFLDNHDWHPNADWQWGKKPAVDTKNGLPQVAPLMVLCATLPGKPLLYNGQEMSFLKVNPPARAEARTQSSVWPFYRSLLELYQTQPAVSEGRFSKLVSNRDDKIYAFVRQREMDRVVVVVNLSDQAQTVILQDASLPGDYRDWFAKSIVKLDAAQPMNLAPWAYRVYVGRAP